MSLRKKKSKYGAAPGALVTRADRQIASEESGGGEVPSRIYVSGSIIITRPRVCTPRAWRAETRGEKEEEKKASVATARSLVPVDAFRRACHSCALHPVYCFSFFFSLFPLPPLSPLTTTEETNGVLWTIVVVARAYPRCCRLVISISDRGWRRLSDERDFPSGGDTVSPRIFFSLPLRALFRNDRRRRRSFFLPRASRVTSIRTPIIIRASN